MLIRKELQAAAPCPPPKRPKSLSERSYHYRAAARVEEFERSGKVLVVDIYGGWNENPGPPIIRFFSDGHSFQVLTDIGRGGWCQRKIGILLRGEGQYHTNEDYLLVKNFLIPNRREWQYASIDGCIDDWVYGISTQKKQRSWELENERRTKHFSMYSPLPSDLGKYCEEHVFTSSYIFIDKVVEKQRKAVCGHCGKHFSVPSSTKSGTFGSCPSCGRPAKYRASWIFGTIEDKAKICIAEKVDGQLLLRWVKVKRTHDTIGKRPTFSFDDYFYRLDLLTPKGPKTYSYRYGQLGYSGWWDWARLKDPNCFDSTFIYTENLDQVFGTNYHNVDLKAGLSGRGVNLNFDNLLTNLRTDPRAEYLFKLNMPTLASQIHRIRSTGGTGFSGVLGVSKQLMPLYSKCDIHLAEHRLISAYGKWVSEEQLRAVRAMDIEGDMDVVVEILKDLSMDRFVRFFQKQKAILPKQSYKWLLTEYRDYLSMSKSLGVDLSRKSVLMPRDVKEAHDTIRTRYNQVRHELEDKAFSEAVSKIYEKLGTTEFARGNYCVVLPQKRSDLITEGQSLNHCVGGEGYAKRHMAGERLIFFIRKASEPHKPFFTAELRMADMKISQLYGFGDCSPKKDVREFAEAFVRRLKSAGEERRTA